ncbi:MAG: exo-alpha-sialidase, partial [Planctomycetaceae bacterium]|nr:exo-alpha-sialidase [Planctomycetaceae bacterium]
MSVQALNTDATTDLGVDKMPTIATDGTRLVTVWSSSNDNETGTDLDLFVAHSTDGGQTWSAPAFLNTDARVDTGNDFRAQLASDGAGVWMVAWDSDASRGGSGTDLDIFLARSMDHGLTWSDPQLVTRPSNTGIDMNVSLATDRAGNWVLAWDTTEDLDGG